MKFWKIFPIFAQENGQNETLKFFELYELQWSRLLHFRSGREATRGLKIKKEKVAGAGMGYCPFSKIESQYNKLYCGPQQAERAHSRLSCIVAHSRLSSHTIGSAVWWHTAG